MALLMILVFAAISARLVQVQAVGADSYASRGLKQRLATVPLPAERGSIFDREGRDFAISVQRETIWADPTLIVDPVGDAARLSPLVAVDQDTLARRLAQSDLRFVYVARAVDDEVAAAVRALELPGIGFLPESRRYYPAGSVAAPVLGEVGGEGSGLGGLEYLYDDVLAGKPGEIEMERDRRGMEIPRTVRRRIDAQRGTDVVLTIDQALQYEVERSLVDQVTATSARGGMAVVMDVQTGDILAMATVDGASEEGPAHPAGPAEHNRPLTDVFEPGSTNKVITVSAAIDNGVVGPWTEFDVPDWISVGDATFTDHDGHPQMRWNTTDIVRESSNVGTILIAQALGKDRLDSALRSFGLGEPTAVDFPGQAEGILLDPDEYYSTGIGSVPIGYGVAVSLLQMLGVYVTIANDGVSQPPRLVGATIDADGARHDRAILEGERVVKPETAAAVTPMLTGVVAGGTGACAAIDGYTVAGKTGTSRKPLEGAVGYSDQYLASFIGFAPAEQPRLAAAIVLDEPVPIYGGRVAAPVFAEIMRAALRLEVVAPPATVIEPAQWEQAAETARIEGADCRVPHGAALDEVVAQRAAEATGSGEAASDDSGVADGDGALAEADGASGSTEGDGASGTQVGEAGTLAERTSPTG